MAASARFGVSNSLSFPITQIDYDLSNWEILSNPLPVEPNQTGFFELGPIVQAWDPLSGGSSPTPPVTGSATLDNGATISWDLSKNTLNAVGELGPSGEHIQVTPSAGVLDDDAPAPVFTLTFPTLNGNSFTFSFYNNTPNNFDGWGVSSAAWGVQVDPFPVLSNQTAKITITQTFSFEISGTLNFSTPMSALINLEPPTFSWDLSKNALTATAQATDLGQVSFQPSSGTITDGVVDPAEFTLSVVSGS